MNTKGELFRKSIVSNGWSVFLWLQLCKPGNFSPPQSHTILYEMNTQLCDKIL